MEIGYHLASEEHAPNALVTNARRAEEAGFAYGIVRFYEREVLPHVDRVLGGAGR